MAYRVQKNIVESNILQYVGQLNSGVTFSTNSENVSNFGSMIINTIAPVGSLLIQVYSQNNLMTSWVQNKDEMSEVCQLGTESVYISLTALTDVQSIRLHVSLDTNIHKSTTTVDRIINGSDRASLNKSILCGQKNDGTFTNLSASVDNTLMVTSVPVVSIGTVISSFAHSNIHITGAGVSSTLNNIINLRSITNVSMWPKSRDCSHHGDTAIISGMIKFTKGVSYITIGDIGFGRYNAQNDDISIFTNPICGIDTTSFKITSPIVNAGQVSINPKGVAHVINMSMNNESTMIAQDIADKMNAVALGFYVYSAGSVVYMRDMLGRRLANNTFNANNTGLIGKWNSFADNSIQNDNSEIEIEPIYNKLDDFISFELIISPGQVKVRIADDDIYKTIYSKRRHVNISSGQLVARCEGFGSVMEICHCNLKIDRPKIVNIRRYKIDTIINDLGTTLTAVMGLYKVTTGHIRVAGLSILNSSMTYPRLTIQYNSKLSGPVEFEPINGIHKMTSHVHCVDTDEIIMRRIVANSVDIELDIPLLPFEPIYILMNQEKNIFYGSIYLSVIIDELD
jgi:hypothetical protein